jgi:hypothetical protein
MFVSLGSSLKRSRFVSSEAPFVKGSVGSVTSSFYRFLNARFSWSLRSVTEIDRHTLKLNSAVAAEVGPTYSPPCPGLGGGVGSEYGSVLLRASGAEVGSRGGTEDDEALLSFPLAVPPDIADSSNDKA